MFSQKYWLQWENTMDIKCILWIEMQRVENQWSWLIINSYLSQPSIDFHKFIIKIILTWRFVFNVNCTIENV